MTSNLKYNRLFTTLAMLFSLCGAEAQTAPALPRLVVNVMIDQLRTDYLEAFSPLFGERGFRRLMLEGSVFTQAEYPFARPDRASATACLHSGFAGQLHKPRQRTTQGTVRPLPKRLHPGG